MMMATYFAFMRLVTKLVNSCRLYEIQALVRQLDHGKKLRIALDSLQELTGKVRSVPARVRATYLLILHFITLQL